MSDDFGALCRSAYGESIHFYRYTVAASTLLAIFCVSIRHVCLRDLIGAPNLAAQFYFVIGTLQLLFSTLDVTIFLPHCPNECLDYCSNNYKPAYFVYPLLATCLGVLLYREALHHLRMARKFNLASDENGMPIVFQRVPVNPEMEMQETA